MKLIYSSLKPTGSGVRVIASKSGQSSSVKEGASLQDTTESLLDLNIAITAMTPALAQIQSMLSAMQSALLPGSEGEPIKVNFSPLTPPAPPAQSSLCQQEYKKLYTQWITAPAKGLINFVDGG